MITGVSRCLLHHFHDMGGVGVSGLPCPRLITCLSLGRLGVRLAYQLGEKLDRKPLTDLPRLYQASPGFHYSFDHHSNALVSE